MSGGEGFLTLAIRMRINPDPMERIRCKHEQMRGTEPPKGKLFPLEREGGQFC